MDTPIQPGTCIVRKTAARKGRTRSVVPGTSAARHLHFGRIILDAGTRPERVDPADHETGLVCLKGSATVQLEGGSPYSLTPYDALYVPHHTVFTVTPGADGCDLAELSAPVSGDYPVQYVSFAGVQKDPGLHFRSGGPNAARDLNILIGKNTQTGRILCGVTFSEPGNWTSWPPHEHSAMLEEAYLYIAMPAPGFAVQLVYTNADEPELATIVREDDVVLMPKGYHPNVAAPGHRIGFLWMMAANREGVDRQFGVVNVQPEFAAGGSGLETGRAK